MKDYSIIMAIFDFVPVFLFSLGAVVLQRNLYNKMGKCTYAIFAMGTINIIFSGAAKALYKLLYAAGICDFIPLNDMFFPVQSIGFLMAGFGIVRMLSHKRKRTALLSAVPPVFTGTAIFVICMCSGLAMLSASLCILSAKLKKHYLILVFAVSFLCSLAMGYLSTKDFTQASLNWIAQIINTVAQGLFCYGSLALRKYGLAQLKLHR